MKNKITVISVNFKTPSLIRECVSSFRKHYPTLSYILVDNGGCADSLKIMRKFAKAPTISLIENGRNIGHGPALHQGILASKTPYVFLLDSDTRTDTPGFLELMLARFRKDKKLFALGWLRYTNVSGVAGPKQHLKRGMRYIHPYACLLDINKYTVLKQPFIHSGAPATKLMRKATKVGYRLQDFPVKKYIWHKVAGTRGYFGGLCKVPTGMKRTRWRKHRI
jgi:glycosyltransferase involved in cell wall biosynthesis